MRILGLGLNGCNKFCGLMDLSSHFVYKVAYDSYIKKMSSIKNIAKRLLSAAIKEEKEATCKANNLEDTSELTVSGDGTWKKTRLFFFIRLGFLDRILYRKSRKYYSEKFVLL